MTDISALEAYAGQLSEAAALATASAQTQRQIVNGDELTDVPTESGSVPTLAKQAVLAQAKVTASLAEVASQMAGAMTYKTTALGIAGTLPGGFFSVPSASDKEYLLLYENVAGLAVATGKSYPSALAVQTLESDFRKVVASGDAPDLLASITDKFGFATWLEARGSDGGPSEHSKALLRKGVPGLPEIGDVPGTMVSVQDENGRKTWLQASSTDGGPTAFAVECIRNALALSPVVETTFVAEGDSMTASAYGGGNPYPVTLASLLGKAVTNVALSGTSSTEISIRAGGVVPLLTIPGGVIPATTAPSSVTWDVGAVYVGTGQPARVYTGKVRGVPCTLRYESLTGLVTLARVTAGAELPVASPIPFIVDVPHMSKRHIVWSGRNDYPKSVAYGPIDQLLTRLEQEGAEYLVVSVCNRSNEPAGSGGHTEVAALNLQLLKRAPRAYVDMRGRMIREGLALAGLAPTAADTAAIAEDCIPPALFDDGLHFNAAGRLACAHIIYNELVLRNMA
jgi:hypothetical protein